MKYKIYCQEKNLGELFIKIGAVGGEVISIQNHVIFYDEPLNTVSRVVPNVWWIDVEPKQANEHRIVAFADIEGTVHSFSDNFQWSKEKIEALDFGLCEKCQQKRPRVKLFWVETEGKVIQVGGSCAANFNCETRIKNLLDIVKELRELLEGGSEGGYGGSYGLNPVSVVNASFLVFKHYGYVSRKAAIDVSSIDIVSTYICNPSEGARKELAQFEKEIDETYGSFSYHYDKLLKYCEEKNAGEFNEFFHNAEIALLNPTPKKFALIVTIAGFYWNSIQPKAEEKEYEKPPVEKINFSGKVLKTKIHQGNFGVQFDITVLDERYGKIWFRSTAKGIDELGVGDKIEGLISISEVKDNIAFGKRPKISNVVKSEIAA